MATIHFVACVAREHRVPQMREKDACLPLQRLAKAPAELEHVLRQTRQSLHLAAEARVLPLGVDPQHLVLVLVEHVLPDLRLGLAVLVADFHRRPEEPGLPERLGLVEGSAQQLVRGIRLAQADALLLEDVHDLLGGHHPVGLVHHQHVELVALIPGALLDGAHGRVVEPAHLLARGARVDGLGLLLDLELFLLDIVLHLLVLIRAQRHEVLVLEEHVATLFQTHLPPLFLLVELDGPANEAVEFWTGLQPLHPHQAAR
mmetsp:Transcript_154191/g.493184  ORF Transcript_154191/g.493184 Transcript_154191/m.493184 type:complete len:259 (-) Transcript_154191:246-1022(-)